MSARFRLHIVRVSSPPEGSVPAERSREPVAARLSTDIPGTPSANHRWSVTTEALLAYTATLLSSYKKAPAAS